MIEPEETDQVVVTEIGGTMQHEQRKEAAMGDAFESDVFVVDSCQ